MTGPAVSVVIPARNAVRRLDALSATFRGQTVPQDLFEVLIVDDGSTDGTVEAVECDGFARVISMRAHGGPYVARNAGIEAARAGLIAFTDTDCKLAGDWVERGVA